MSSVRRCLVAILSLCVLAPLWLGAPVPSEQEKIARWIRQLGDNDFERREEASDRLWKAGEPAEAALLAVVDSPDAEVSRRARDILDRFKWGIYPDTPKRIVDLIARYQTGDRGNGAAIIRELFESGAAGCKAVLKIARAEEDAGVRRRVLAQIANEMPRCVPLLLAEDSLDTLALLVETGMDQDVKTGVGHFVAFWTLRGKLDEQIAAYRAKAAKGADDKKACEVLAYLLRAKGDLASAREAAAKAERTDLVDALLFEEGAWRELARRPVGTETTHDVERLGLQAAYHRLAGNSTEFEAALAGLRKLAAATKDDEGTAMLVAKALFLNDRPAEALEELARAGRKAMVFEILTAQLKFPEAMKLLERERAANGKELPHLEILAARTLHGLGEKDKALAVFAKYGNQLKEGAEFSWADTLIESEMRLGLRENALAHAAQVLRLAKNESGSHRQLFAKLFPSKGEQGEVWWTYLRQRDEKRDAAATLKQVGDILDGKWTSRQIDDLVEGAQEALKQLHPRPEVAEQWEAAIAEAALGSGSEEVARKLLAKATTAAALRKLGDLHAGKKQWDTAAERYRAAWERDRQQPLSLFLWGRALVVAGQEKEGQRRMEQSHWLPLGNEMAREEFIRALSQRGLVEASRRENALLVRLSQPASFYSGEAQRRAALAAQSRKDYLRSADGHERAMLRCLRTYVTFTAAPAFVGVPALVHRQRARGLLAAGRVDDVLREAALCEAALPGNVDVAVQLAPELERVGRTKEAAGLFYRANGVLEAICKDYPRCAWAHNSAAWLSACCRRNLDEALAHALKATELAPDAAGHFDTLAEVYFQRGDKTKAIAVQQKAIELDPKRAYFRKQLRRLEAGNAAAPRPPETDDEDDED